MVFDLFQNSEFPLSNLHKIKMSCAGFSCSRPTGAFRISSGGHLSSGFHRCPLSRLIFRSACDANFVVSCSSTSGPSDSLLENASNRSYSRRWLNPIPRRRHPDQMLTCRIFVRDWIDSDTSSASEGSVMMISWNRCFSNSTFL